MSNFPQNFDDDTTLPVVNDNLTEIGGDAINALRDAVFNIEMNIGLGAAGTTPSIAARLGLLINPDGTPNASTITSLGLVTLPITQDQIIDNAQIPESKLRLDHRTQDLFNYIRDLSRDINLALGWISVSGTKLEPHLIGAIYRHDLSQIDVAEDPTQFLNNVFRTQRDNTNSYTLINDMNNELLHHQWADGSPFGTLRNITTNNGSVYPSFYAHVASGIFLESSIFGVIPQTVQDVQALAEFIDQSSIFLFGTRIQNFYANGVSRNSRSSVFAADGYGQSLVPSTPAITYLSTTGPNDDILTGDDIVQFVPPSDGYLFNEQFALVRVGDIVRVNYGTIETQFVIKEINPQTLTVRIAGKNLAANTKATARIDKPLFNNNKYGVLAVAAANNVYDNTSSTIQPSLIVGSPRGAQALGLGFNPDQFDGNHYLLYLALFPTGNLSDGYVILPAIDVTGNQGTQPGSYTLNSIVNATNDAFRRPGYNYRFIAFEYQGNFGIMLADPYHNASFSIVNGAVAPTGFFDPLATSLSFPKNVIDVFPPNLPGTFNVSNGSPTVAASISQPVTLAGDIITFSSQPNVTYTISPSFAGGTSITLTTNYLGTNNTATNAQLPNNSTPPDPLGIGPLGSNIASPPYIGSYGSVVAAQNATKLFIPLTRNTYYVNGTERDRLNLDVGQTLDNFGDGYWVATISAVNVIPGTRTEVTYNVPLNLSTSQLKPGKTLVVQALGGDTGLVDYGRFTIKNVVVQCAPNVDTLITVYDGVHATGVSPLPPTDGYDTVGSKVALYFNSDSVSFNAENSSDLSGVGPFKRYFESFIDQNGNTYTSERGRFYIGSSNIHPQPPFGGWIPINGSFPTNLNRLFTSTGGLQSFNIVEISPKLRGYQFGLVNKITLTITAFDMAAGNYTGYLARFDDVKFTYSNQGPLISGTQGQVTRFYDETNVDHIDLVIDINAFVSPSPGQVIDIQLFPTLDLDEEIMPLNSCQVTDNVSAPQISYLIDRRQFGNISEEQLSTSAIGFIEAAPRLLNGSGVIRGFDLEDNRPDPNNGQIYLMGGEALVNGSFIQMNADTITVPLVQELFSTTLYNINWALCVNSQSEYILIPLLDVDLALPTPPTSDRIVRLQNIVGGQVYNIPAILFSDIIDTRKDLAPLYFVTSTVTGETNPSISLNITDLRKYVNDLDTNLPLRFTPVNAQGNFHSAVAIFNWIKYNGSFNGVAFVKGANGASGTINTSLNLDFTSTVSIDGQNDATLTFNGPVVLGSNLTLQNMDMTFNGPLSIATGVTNLNLLNCNITINLPNAGITTPLTRQYALDILGGSHIKIDGGFLIVNFGNNTTAGSVFRLNNTLDFTYSNNINLTANFRNVVGSGTSVPGDIFILKDSDSITITHSLFSGNFNQLWRNTGTNRIVTQNATIDSTYNPLLPSLVSDAFNSTTDPDGIADGLPTVVYNNSFTNFVNSGRGVMYAHVSDILHDILIDKVVFNYTPSTPSSSRFSSINFELSTMTAILSNVSITNCQFINTTADGSSDDNHASIAIINTSPSTVSTNLQQPIIQNVKILNNTHNRNQTIIVTSVTDGTGKMTYPGLWPQNCLISGNTCGNIGYWVSSGAKADNSLGQITTISDKVADLTISDNNCHYIANLDHAGLYFIVSKLALSGATVNQSAYPSGFVTIENNSANWIHVGIAFEDVSALRILDNSLTAYNTDYIGAFSDNEDVGIQIFQGLISAVSTHYAIVVSANNRVLTPAQPPSIAPSEGNDSSVIISGNTTSTGYWLQPNGTSTTYNYKSGYVFCHASSIITKNTFKGFGQTLFAGGNPLVLVGGLHNIVTQNNIYRQGSQILCYVGFGSPDHNTTDYSWNGYGSTGLVTNNFFDSSYNIDGVTSSNTATAAQEATVQPPPAILYGTSAISQAPLSGTFSVINGSSSVTATVSQPISLAGNIIILGTFGLGGQPDVQYVVSPSFTGGTAITLTSNFTGSTTTGLQAFNTFITNWTVTQNKNQISYVSIPLTSSQLATYGRENYPGGTGTAGVFADSEGFVAVNPASPAYYVGIAPTVASSTGFGYRSLTLFIHDGFTDSRPRFIGWQESLDKYLPRGSRVLLLKIGAINFSTGTVTTSGAHPSRFYLYLTRYIPNATAPTPSPGDPGISGILPFDYLNMDTWAFGPGASPDPHVANDAAIQQTTPVSSTISPTDLNSGVTKYATIDTTTLGGTTNPTTTPVDVSSAYTIGGGSPLTVSIDFRFTGNASAVDFYISPLFVKFVW